MIISIRWKLIVLTIALISTLAAAGCSHSLRPPEHGIYMLDAGNRPVKSLQAGSSLHIAGVQLAPRTLYHISLLANSNNDSNLVSFSRVATDSNGVLPPHILWFHSGVVGCSLRAKHGKSLPPFMYQSFEEAERDLVDRRLEVVIRPVLKASGSGTDLMKLPLGEIEYRIQVPVTKRVSPMVFASDESGCLRNSLEVSRDDMFVTGRGFSPNEQVEIMVLDNQRAWHIGDRVIDVTGRNKPIRIRADGTGRFTAMVWSRNRQRRGVFDILVRRRLTGTDPILRVRANDIISYGSDSAYLLYLRYPTGGPLMDIAGRPLSGSPYFEYADSFADHDDSVWGAVDPTYVPDSHPGGRYAAYYVVAHRSSAGWDPALGGSNSLTASDDVSGGVEIVPVKAGCINGTDVPIWDANPLDLGDYDVVINFGGTPAETGGDYDEDNTYDPAIDFLDGADQIGFVVAKDPYEMGDIPVGRRQYSQDDYFDFLGDADDVDLRAIVHYPATAAGENTPVAAGQHPIFIIEHGNHLTCNITRDGQDPYDLIAAGTFTLENLYEYDDCPDRKENHAGYNDLLDILARNGIIAVSIDAYDLTSCTESGCRPQWIEERGDLILKHLELWSHMNDPSLFPSYPDFFSGAFAGHVDLNKISVSGHSRGGEASVAAYVRNAASSVPFQIGSVSSIAPVDGLGYVLPDVPFFVILPAADGDVFDLSGAQIYDRAGNSTDDTVKSGIHVYGASHNFFNTIWAADGDDSWTPRDDYIDPADQQRLGEAYLAAFTMAELLDGDFDVYQDMLRGRLTFPSTSGFKIYHFRHEKNHQKVESGTVAGSPDTMTATMSSGPSVHSTDAVLLEWSSHDAKLTYTISDGNLSSFEVISFRAAQTNDSSNPPSGSQDFKIELLEGTDKKAVYVGRFDPIPHPYDRLGTDHNVMTTVRVPLHSFIMNNSGVDLANIDTVRLLFFNPSNGQIIIDDIEFSR